jgi:tetratricopeptide (TPR) repeat protein
MSMFQSNNPVAQAIRHLRAGQIQKAEGLCRQILTREKKNAQAMAVLGQIATMQSRFDEAASLLSKCITLAPREVDYQLLLAEVRMTQAKHRQALVLYDKALKLQRDYPPALAGKANVLIRQGRTERARSLLQPYVKRGVEDAGMAVVFARAERQLGDPELAAAIARRHVADPVQPQTTRSLWFEIAKSCQKAGDYDSAFEAYAAGNALGAGGWDPDAESRRYDETMGIFSAETIARLPRASKPSDLPVFIVGMPRSGSTLVEQIIDAHPQAFGAGELLFLPTLIDDLGLRIGSDQPYPRCAAEMDQADVDALSESYVTELQKLAPRATRICDKYLGSYEHLGLIRVLFPNARIIHTVRNPLDTCLSCFVQKFAPGVPAYTENLRHLGRLYLDYERIMRYWNEVLDIEILEVRYEEVVVDIDAQIRRIIDYCGLEWDERCLRYYETGREVLTLSREQVNRPVYTSSVGRYRKYEPHLGPLKEELVKGGWTEEALVRAATLPG